VAGAKSILSRPTLHTKENPLDTDAVSAKTRDLTSPVLGPAKADRLIEQLNTLEKVNDVRKLRPLLSA
jgi:hypothetical protein